MKCAICKQNFPEELLSPIYGSNPTGPVCGVCYANTISPDYIPKGRIAEYVYYEALEIWEKNGRKRHEMP